MNPSKRKIESFSLFTYYNKIRCQYELNIYKEEKGRERGEGEGKYL
jgi:hypothetical protein